MRIFIIISALFFQSASASTLEQFFTSGGGTTKHVYVVHSDGVTRLGRYLGMAEGYSNRAGWMYLDADTSDLVRLDEEWGGNISTIYYASSGCTGTRAVMSFSGTRGVFTGDGTIYSVSASLWNPPSMNSYKSGSTCTNQYFPSPSVKTISPVASPKCGSGNCKLVLLPDP